MPPVRLTPNVLEGVNAVYTATLVDENDVAIAASALFTLTLTYCDVTTRLILNGRAAQNALNQNNVTIDNAGLLTWKIQPADTGIINDGLAVEIHRALFTWTWGSPVKVGRHEIDLGIENLLKVV